MPGVTSMPPLGEHAACYHAHALDHAPSCFKPCRCHKIQGVHGKPNVVSSSASRTPCPVVSRCRFVELSCFVILACQGTEHCAMCFPFPLGAPAALAELGKESQRTQQQLRCQQVGVNGADHKNGIPGSVTMTGVHGMRASYAM